ncbi:putative lipoprotein [Streptococcus ictaluri 707-05]|uniref:Lipoprotein n=1 Tax=Streptococcus ictaluri 707-05 TaxID=764299 RepID=G5K1V5_9STRE|nr:putative lipoprotein [Streptococcus ictaluri 707-05]
MKGMFFLPFVWMSSSCPWVMSFGARAFLKNCNIKEMV